MLTATYHRQPLGQMVAVHATEDIEYLVKESEVITGRLGRKFLIASADRLAYLVQWHPDSYQIQRLDQEDKPICTLTLLASEFQQHILGEALHAGQLFTSPVNRQR
ncbi:hypothetical protein EGT07_24970 [Herbaspirillum sp. HC18]|nr:hypothetical protein EGT07_24970 [Herbaspirillum sp. HC18]